MLLQGRHMRPDWAEDLGQEDLNNVSRSDFGALGRGRRGTRQTHGRCPDMHLP